jgi:hypothetical protein
VWVLKPVRRRPRLKAHRARVPDRSSILDTPRSNGRHGMPVASRPLGLSTHQIRCAAAEFSAKTAVDRRAFLPRSAAIPPNEPGALCCDWPRASGRTSGTRFHKNDGITNLFSTRWDPRGTPREQSVWCGRELSDNLCASIPYAQVRENSDPLRANGYFQRRPHCRQLRIPTPPVLCVYKDCRDESSCREARRRLLKILLSCSRTRLRPPVNRGPISSIIGSMLPSRMPTMDILTIRYAG